MVAELAPEFLPEGESATRSLLLIWQDPESRKFVAVGRIWRGPDGAYHFRYLQVAAVLPGFHPLVDYPDLAKSYRSETLPAFFANRVMSSRRESFPEYLTWLGLAGEDGLADLPFEVLATTGGSRVTDTFHIVESPDPHRGNLETKFFVSGVRHCDGAEQAISRLQPGEQLKIAQQPDNPENRLALCVHDQERVQLGWIPDWMLEVVRPYFDRGSIIVTVDRVNLDAPAHLRLLCRIVGKL